MGKGSAAVSLEPRASLWICFSWRGPEYVTLATRDEVFVSRHLAVAGRGYRYAEITLATDSR